MKYTKEQFLKAAEIGEVSMIDAKHICSLLDKVDVPQQNDVREDDVEKLLSEMGEPDDAFQQSYKVGFEEGYNKCKENTYTEEQLDKAISWGINNGRKGDVTITDIDNFIQSLKK